MAHHQAMWDLSVVPFNLTQQPLISFSTRCQTISTLGCQFPSKIFRHDSIEAINLRQDESFSTPAESLRPDKNMHESRLKIDFLNRTLKTEGKKFCEDGLNAA